MVPYLLQNQNNFQRAQKDHLFTNAKTFKKLTLSSRRSLLPFKKELSKYFSFSVFLDPEQPSPTELNPKPKPRLPKTISH
jgi:hypothetical protein